MTLYKVPIKIPILKLTYRFNKIPIRIPGSSRKTDNLIPKCLWEGKGPKIIRIILKNNKVEGLTLFGFKTYSTKRIVLH